MAVSFIRLIACQVGKPERDNEETTIRSFIISSIGPSGLHLERLTREGAFLLLYWVHEHFGMLLRDAQ